jgi:cytoskeletal protein CcmA (bactofilin family)
MFKRNKDVSDEDSTNESAPSRALRQVETGEDNSGEDNSGEAQAARTLIPSYELRKPTVRTLQSHAANSSTTPSPTAANLHVGRGLKLEGKIQSCDSLVIEGDVQATIESGTLTISETGDVRGEATVDTAEINGKFEGKLTVRKCLSINATGRVTGTIRYGELKVEQGGKISGEVGDVEMTETPVTRSPIAAHSENGFQEELHPN